MEMESDESNISPLKKPKVHPAPAPSLWNDGGVLCQQLDILKDKLKDNFGNVLLNKEEKMVKHHEHGHGIKLEEGMECDKDYEQKLYETISKQAVEEMKSRKIKLQELKSARKDIELNLVKGKDKLNSQKSNSEDILITYTADIQQLDIKHTKSLAEKNQKLKEMKILQPEIKDLEEKLSQLKEKYKSLEAGAKKIEVAAEKIKHEKISLDTKLKNDNQNLENQTKECRKEIEQWNLKLQKNLDETENLVLSETLVKQESKSIVKETKAENVFLEHLTGQIKKLEGDLECPVCFEVVQSPIYTCPESHLICKDCRPKMPRCPECRIPYQKEKKIHRYAEKQIEELVELRKKKITLLEKPALTDTNVTKDNVKNKKRSLERPEKTVSNGITSLSQANLPKWNKLFIGNIPDQLDMKDLEQLFKSYGTVAKVEISAQCHRFGTVYFTSKEGVENTLKNRHNIAVRNRKTGEYKRLRVNERR